MKLFKCPPGQGWLVVPDGTRRPGIRMHEHHRTVSSYVTQMSLVKNCPSHIKGAYKVQDAKVLLFGDDAEESSAE
jgi:hypothetical protein